MLLKYFNTYENGHKRKRKEVIELSLCHFNPVIS